MKKADSTTSSVEFPPDVYAIIEETMVAQDMGLGAAVRFLIKKGKLRIEWEAGAVRMREETEREIAAARTGGQPATFPRNEAQSTQPGAPRPTGAVEPTNKPAAPAKGKRNA